ncbi:hypothetical protein QFZ60_000774 [Arthrobacter sp. B2I5]|uniref:O-antigen ligase family protein n=1 Tax=Arthrobacter sp. B2I5 TaxID=3042266 RepID=UPI00277F0CAB|nr:O-antigen ligase family protein [Arthrobacter sp. B2I5]MDQ0824601.1 hypothetical protein [Arthrobacter sp. B2I5]
MTYIWLLFQALAGLVAFGLFVLALKKWPIVGIGSAAFYTVIAWEVPYPPPLVSLGGFSVYYLDVLSIAFLIVAFSQFARLVIRLRAAVWYWLGFGSLLLVSLALGLAANSTGTALNEFRPFLYPYAMMTWAMALYWDYLLVKHLLLRFSVFFGWLLTIVATYHIALHGLGSTSGFVDSGTGLEQTTRPLVSGQALAILLCAIVCLWFWREYGGRGLLFSSVVFFGVVLVSQQRTVWAVAFSALFVVFLSAQARLKFRILFSGLVAVALLFVVTGTQLMPDVLGHLFTAAEDSGTYDGRMRSWLNLLSQSVQSGPLTVAFGEPMGSGFGRYESAGRWVLFAPHNWYLTLYLRVGILGLAVFLCFLFVVFSRLLRQRSNMAAIAIATALIVYGWSYSWIWYISMFLGWTFVQASTKVGLREEQVLGSRARRSMSKPRNSRVISDRTFQP